MHNATFITHLKDIFLKKSPIKKTEKAAILCNDPNKNDSPKVAFSTSNKCPSTIDDDVLVREEKQDTEEGYELFIISQSGIPCNCG